MKICPCQKNPHQASDKSLSELTYENCCKPFHDQTKLPETAEQLMRSRYCAFYLHQVDYIIATTLPAQQKFLDTDALLHFATETNWQGLAIQKHTAKLGKRHAQVEFKAYFDTPSGMQAHHELSAFVKASNHVSACKDKQWYFLDPTLGIKIPQKQPCICGSGEKFKRCCGKYL